MNKIFKTFLSCILTFSFLFLFGSVMPVSAEEIIDFEADDFIDETDFCERETEENSLLEQQDYSEIDLEENPDALSAERCVVQMIEVEDISVIDNLETNEVMLQSVEAANGTCGDNAVWSFENGVLTIEGTGSIKWAWDSINTENVTKIIVNGSVTALVSDSLISGVFSDFTNVKEVTLSDSITDIGAFAFSGCRALKEIELPDDLINIGECAFKSCVSLEKVTFSEKTESIGANAFDSCISLKNVTIPNSVKNIGSHAFYNCSALSTVRLSNQLTCLKQSVFNGCSDLISIEIPNSVTEIENSAFCSCSSLETINLSSNLNTLGTGVFWGCSKLSKISVPYGIKQINSDTFRNCYSLTSIQIPSSVESIGSGVFTNCYSLPSIKIPKGVSNIGETVFYNCLGLKTIKLPKDITISYDAFIGCYLEMVYGYKGTISEQLASDAGCDFYDLTQIDTALSRFTDLSTIRLSDRSIIEKASTVAEWLDDDQISILSNAKTQVEAVVKESVSNVESMILALPSVENVDLTDMESVQAAYDAYFALPIDIRKQVSRDLFSKVDESRSKLLTYEKEMQKAIKTVSCLPSAEELTYDDLGIVILVRGVYDDLSEGAKTLFPSEDYNRLLAAEKRMEELKECEIAKRNFIVNETEDETEGYKESVNVHTHSFGKWETISEATVFSPEIQSHTCTCTHTETRTVGSKLNAVLELQGASSSFSIKKSSTTKCSVILADGDSLSDVSSNKTSVLKVSLKYGRVVLNAVKTGTAKVLITAASGKSRTYTVKVVSGTVKTTGLTVTSVTNKKLTLAKGKTHTLKTEVKPFTSTQKLTYVSSNKKVVTVTSSGKVKAVAPGRATITVKSGSKNVKIVVTVPGITNVKSSISIKKNKTLVITPKMYGISGKVTYTSSNKKVATVTSKGKIKGIKKGTAKITINAGAYTKTVTVKII